MRKLSFLCVFFLISMISTAAQPQPARDYVYGPRGKLAVTIEPDNYPPGLPASCSSSLSGQCAESGIDVSWGTATDIGSGVSYYKLYRNGSFVTSFTTQFSYHDSNIVAGQEYTYCVSAVDNAGHEGNQNCASPVYYEFCWGSLFFGPEKHHATASAAVAVTWNPSLLMGQRRVSARRVALIPSRKRVAVVFAGGGQ